jgi:hypothetical protein
MRCLVFASNNENADVSTLHSRSATRAKLFFYLLLPAVQNSTPWSFQRKKEGEKDKYISTFGAFFHRQATLCMVYGERYGIVP